jgi:hypothetical protein
MIRGYGSDLRNDTELTPFQRRGDAGVHQDTQTMLKPQVRCAFTIRFVWDVSPGQNHPAVSFGCAEDVEQAAEAARRASVMAPRGIRLTGAEVSASGGRFDPWEPLDLGASA